MVEMLKRQIILIAAPPKRRLIMFPNLFSKRIYSKPEPSPFEKVFVAHCPYCNDGARGAIKSAIHPPPLATAIIAELQLTPKTNKKKFNSTN